MSESEPAPATVRVEVTMPWSMMATSTLVLLFVLMEHTGVLVAVGGVPVTVGVLVGVLVRVGVSEGVKVLVGVGHTPEPRVKNRRWPLVRLPDVRQEYCVKRLPVSRCTPTTAVLPPPATVP